MELIKPTQVVKQANVKIAAKRIAPPSPNTGNTTAVNKKLAIAVNVCSPAFCPMNGGKIKFPAQKNSENNIKRITTIFFLFNFIFFLPAHKKRFIPKHETNLKSAVPLNLYRKLCHSTRLQQVRNL